MIMKDIRAAAVQFNHAPGDKAANLLTVKAFVEQAASRRVQLIVFPEMCITGYWHVRKLTRRQIDDLAEPVPSGPSTRQLLSWAAEKDMTIGAGLIERGDDGQLYNAYVVAMPDGQFACHRKLHCFVSQHMASGDQFTVFDTPHGCRVGVLICYDNNIGENVRITALQGAEILLAPHQTGGCDSPSPGCMGKIDPALWEDRHKHPSRIEAEFRSYKGRAWLMRWLPARAHDNGIFLVYANGVGVDDDEQSRRRDAAQRLYHKRGFTADRVARAIVDAVQGNRAEVPVSVEASGMRLIGRWAPGLARRLARLDVAP